MFKKIIFLLLPLPLLAACSNTIIPMPAVTVRASPSQPPAILSPTPSSSPSGISTPPTPTPTSTTTLTPTPKASPTSSPTPTLTPPPPMLALDILGCNTSMDVVHLMGEVTNAYPLIQNKTGVTLTNVCAVLSASDETGNEHPDKRVCVPSLSPGYQIILKLTVDSAFKKDTSIQVDVSTRQGYTASLARPSCRDIGLPGGEPDYVGLPQPIP